MSKITADTINVSINLTDLDKSKFTTDANGKKYLNFSLNARKEPDKFGNDLTIAYKKAKGEETTYIKGNAKTVTFDNTPTAQAEAIPFKSDTPDDLPF
jgi:hypothetical protein